MVEMLGNTEGQWGAFSHLSYHSSTASVFREPLRNEITKGNTPSRLHLTLKRRNKLQASEYQDRWEQCKKEVKSKTNGLFANI